MIDEIDIKLFVLYLLTTINFILPAYGFRLCGQEINTIKKDIEQLQNKIQVLDIIHVKDVLHTDNPNIYINTRHAYENNNTDYTSIIEIPNVTVTAYNNRRNQTDSTPNIMASGRRVYEGAIALSRDLLATYNIKWGDVVCLEANNRCYIVEDTMNARYDNRKSPGSGNRADIFLFSYDQAKKTFFKTTLRIIKER